MKREIERRSSAAEIRIEGRMVTGVALRYGAVSVTHREKFAPGALLLADRIVFDLHHDREKAIGFCPGGGLEMRSEDDAMMLSCEVPPTPAGDRALDEIRTGKATGLSIEFHSVKDHHADGLRVIEEAILSGVGLVRLPSYSDSQVEARARRRRIWL